MSAKDSHIATPMATLPVQPTSPAAPSVWGAARRAFAQPRFLGAVIVLAVAGIGLNAAAGFLKLHFRKLPVPLPVPSLQDEALGLPAAIGHAPNAPQIPCWIQVSRDQPLSSEYEQSLGTHEHVFRDYVDVSLLLQIRGSSELKDRSKADELWGEGEFLSKGGPFEQFHKSSPPQELVNFLIGLRHRPDEERMKIINRISQSLPQALVRMQMTYYTGSVDTVAHIPERCFVADGYESVAEETRSEQFTGFPDGKPRDVGYRFLQFEDKAGGRGGKFVAYLFHVNGAYESSPLDVRKRLQRLTERYGYYSKVELMTGGGDPRDSVTVARNRAVATINDFLQAALPEVERCLPDWHQFRDKSGN